MAFVPARGLTSLGSIQASLERAARACRPPPGAGLVLDAESLLKLKWLERDGRDFRKVTPGLLRRMEVAFMREESRIITGEQPSEGAPWTAAVTEYRDVVAERLNTSGGDVEVTPLAASTIKRKGNARVGYATGDLQRRVASAPVRNTR